DSPLPSRGVVWDGLVDELALPLLGEHQRLNAALAVATARVLQNKIPVSDEAIRRGLETVQWPGRSQLVTTVSGQTFLLDGVRKGQSGRANHRLSFAGRCAKANGQWSIRHHHRIALSRGRGDGMARTFAGAGGRRARLE